ncbi:CheR family methyltransferase [Muricoccus radiodurans]|uniref:CheR family methyltransferase n=1 Tax=Muricoccus radiodurans TaxID=2231721 RepID=UPI003CEDA4DA
MTPGRGLPAAPDDPAFPRLKDLVIARTGHHYYADKDAALWERLSRRIRETGDRNGTAYLARLQGPATAAAEWAALEAEVTIGETFFFRDAGQFAALRDTILPDILARRAMERSIRVWSAGCATGAEPYSVAILLRRMLGDLFGTWRIGILGTDISEAALRAARRGRFSPWALRGMDPAERERDFIRDGEAWQLRPEHRALVRFEHGNLLSLLEEPAPIDPLAWDLILCRNVLIYFHHDTVTRVVRALGARLDPEGWLLLGHAEPNPAFAEFLRPIALPGATAWRPGVAEPPPPQPPPILPWPAWTPPPRPAVPPPEPRPAPRPTAPARLPPAGRAVRDAVRAQADRGELEAARRTLRTALAAAPTEPALHYLDGMVSLAGGDAAAAEAALRRALYLDKGFVTAHYQLGLLLLATGRAEAGRRSVANAVRLARALPGETVLEEGDGMTASALLRLARSHPWAPEG